MQPRLITITGPMKGTVIQLSDEQLSIGRDPSNQVTINDPLLSRKHCAIRNSGGEIRVADLESLNGTFVNGFPTHEKKLEHGDRIKVGVSQFIFLLEDDADVTDVPLTDAAEEQFITAVTVKLDQDDSVTCGRTRSWQHCRPTPGWHVTWPHS